MAEQRRAYGAGQMSGLRARRLEKLGMVWSVADERFQENLEAASGALDGRPHLRSRSKLAQPNICRFSILIVVPPSTPADLLQHDSFA